MLVDRYVTPWLQNIQVLSFLFPMQLEHCPWHCRIQYVFPRRNCIAYVVLLSTILRYVFCNESIFSYFKVKGRLVPFTQRPTN
jgi:hypothetical protein